MSTYERDIKEYYQDKMPEHIQILAAHAMYDLNFGPLYLSEEDESCSPFDEDSHRFDFTDACSKLSEWCEENTHTLYLETWSGYLERDQPEGWDSYLEIDEAAQKKILFGELAAYL